MNILSIDLKSLGHTLCRFKPGSGYQKEKAVADLSATAFLVPQTVLQRPDTPARPREGKTLRPRRSRDQTKQGGPASIRNGLEDALHPASAAMQMQ